MNHFFAIFAAELGLLALAVLVAWIQSIMIKDKETIYHTLWFCIWVALTGLSAWPLWADLHTPPLWAEEMSGRLIPWAYITASGCGHLVAFNICLNRFRGLPWTYTSIKTGSIIDHIELAIWGSRFWVVEVILGVLWIVLQFFFL